MFTCRIQGSKYKCLSIYISYRSFSFRFYMSYGSAELRFDCWVDVDRGCKLYNRNKHWQYDSKVVAWGQKGIFILILWCGESICWQWLAVDAQSKNSLEFGRVRGGQTRPGPGAEESQSYLQTALPGRGRGNSVRRLLTMAGPRLGSEKYLQTETLSWHLHATRNKMSFLLSFF